MRINYRFYDNFNKKDVLEFKNMGIEINEGIDAFVIYEDDPLFEKVKNKFGVDWMENVSVVDTDFTEKERCSSDFLNIEATKMLGYPQPEDWDNDNNEPAYPFNIYPYFEGVFEVKNTSPNFGMLRGKQIGSFSLWGEPKWGKSSIGSIFWSEDVFFVSTEIYHSILEPLGIKCLPVLAYGNQMPLQTIVQLVSQGVSKSKLDIQDNQTKEIEYVKEWDMEKYILNGKGFYPSFANNPGKYDFFVSQEHFGSGGANLKNVFISQKLYQIFKVNKITGVKYYPVHNP